MKVKKSWILLFATMLMAYPAAAQSTSSAQTQASTSTSAQAKAGKADVKADANASADASAKTSASRSQQENKEKEKGTKANARGSAKASSQGSAQASGGDKSLNLSNGTTLEATLTKSLGVKNNKVGDEVVAKVTKDVKSDGQVVVPKGSKLIGHVTEAKARGKCESESALGLAFDRAVMKDGREVPVNLAIQAVASAQTAASSAISDDGLMSSAGGSGSASGSTVGAVAPARSGGSSGGGLLGGVGSTVSGATSTVGSVAGSAGGAVGGTVNSATQVTGSGSGSAGGLNALGNLTSQSSGVFGLQGLQLSSEASHATEGSLLVSSTRNVHLDSGTRILLRAEGSADAKPKQ
jgi:hypothetical protein